jgi:hypothetical protein
MPSIRFNSQMTNKDPLGPGLAHGWVSRGLQEQEVVVITATAFSHGTGASAYASEVLAVENVRVETTLDKEGDPTRNVWFQVRNAGASTVERYGVNVAFLSP